jgi:hypothetical protein
LRRLKLSSGQMVLFGYMTGFAGGGQILDQRGKYCV